jgi:hypothetical protein
MTVWGSVTAIGCRRPQDSRRQRSELRDSCATRTTKLVQEIGQSSLLGDPTFYLEKLRL